MKRSFIALASLAVLYASAAQATDSARECGIRNDIVDKLAKDYKEAPMAVAQVNDKAVLEIFVSNTGTWTIIATGTDGNSCVLSAGENFESTIFVKGSDA